MILISFVRCLRYSALPWRVFGCLIAFNYVFVMPCYALLYILYLYLRDHSWSYIAYLCELLLLAISDHYSWGLQLLSLKNCRCNLSSIYVF